MTIATKIKELPENATKAMAGWIGSGTVLHIWEMERMQDFRSYGIIAAFGGAWPYLRFYRCFTASWEPHGYAVSCDREIPLERPVTPTRNYLERLQEGDS